MPRDDRPPRSRSPPPHLSSRHRSRSRSPQPRRRDEDRDRRPPRPRYNDDEHGRRNSGSDRDRNSRRRDEGGYRDRDDRRGGQPPPPPPQQRSRSPPGRNGGDGGWGRAPTGSGGTNVDGRLSPGRPSLALERNGERDGAGRRGGPLPSQLEAMGGKEGDGDKQVAPPVKPIEPNFAPSGALAAETNTLRGVVLKYNEPPEARKSTKNWRLYAFKGKEQVDLFHVHRQSAYLIGRDRIVADIPIDHPSSSKQHAVLQFRQVVERNEFGDTKSLTKPFIIDLDSANGTTVNDETVPPSRYYELKTGDVLKFAFSTREYVLLVEN